VISVFISYAREDEDDAKGIYQLLKRNGYAPWMNKEDLLPGLPWERAIEHALKRSDAQIFLFSERSAKKRGVFQREIQFALSKIQDMLEDDISIIPLKLGECEVPMSLSKYQWLELEKPEWEKTLLKALGVAALQRGAAMEESPSKPFVVGVKTKEELSSDGKVQASYSVPELKIPANEELSQMINAIFLSEAGKAVLGMHTLVDDEFDKHMTRKYFSDVSTELYSVDEYVISARTSVYIDAGGAHGNGSTKATNIVLTEKRLFSGSDIFSSSEFICDCIDDEAASSQDVPIISKDEYQSAVEYALFANTLINQEGVSVNFNQYEVFCYAHGPFSIEFSWTSLDDRLLTSFGRLVKAHFLK
jgi:hypothetical protein